VRLGSSLRWEVWGLGERFSVLCFFGVCFFFFGGGGWCCFFVFLFKEREGGGERKGGEGKGGERGKGKGGERRAFALRVRQRHDIRRRKEEEVGTEGPSNYYAGAAANVLKAKGVSYSPAGKGASLKERKQIENSLRGIKKINALAKKQKKKKKGKKGRRFIKSQSDPFT